MTLKELVKLGQVRPHVARHIEAQRRTAENLLGMHKRADGGWRQFGLATAAAVAAPLAIAGINKVISSVTDGLAKGKNFRAMMETTPELGEMDRVKVQKAFNTLQKFAPSLASDPSVAGTWVRRTADYDMIDHKSVSELIKAEKDLSQTRSGFLPELGSPGITLASYAYPKPRD